MAAISAVATTALWIGVFTQIVLPTHTKALENSLAQLEKERINTISASKKREEIYLARIEKESAEKTDATSGKKNLEIRLNGLTVEQRFSRSTPFPSDFRQVDIGSTISNVEDFYKGRSEGIEKLPGWYSVRFSDGPYAEITYYRLVDDDDAAFISQVLFHFRDRSAQNIAVHKAVFTSLYGTPVTVKSRYNEIEHKWQPIGQWRQKGAYELELGDSSLLIKLNCATWSDIYKKAGSKIDCTK